MTAAITRQPTVRVNGPGSLSVCGLGRDLLVLLARRGRLGDDLKSLFQVRVAQAPSPEAFDLPPVSGRYHLEDDEVQFLPHFPFEKGLTYRLRFDPQSLGAPHAVQPFNREFTIPEQRNTHLLPEVTCVFPSGDVLPENLLRFYVCFSNSMQRGRVLKEISLVDSVGRPVSDALYRQPVELWDRSMSQLTVLLDPGRLKRWVGPNVELGPPLEVGKNYALEIGEGMTDMDDLPLRAPFRKHFVVGDPVRSHVSTESWTIHPPAADSHQPLVLMFRNPLDWALLLWTIRVASPDGSVLDGNISIDQEEKRWRFIPVRPWTRGVFHIHVDPGLEDVCGNNLSGAFDRALRKRPDLATTTNRTSLCFQVT